MGGWPFSLISLFVPLLNYLLWFETIIWRVLYTFDLLYNPNFISFSTLFTFLPTMFLYLYSRFSQQCFSTCIHVSPNNVSLPVFHNIKCGRNVNTLFIIRKHREISKFDYFIILFVFFHMILYFCTYIYMLITIKFQIIKIIGLYLRYITL